MMYFTVFQLFVFCFWKFQYLTEPRKYVFKITRYIEAVIVYKTGRIEMSMSLQQ